MKAYLLKRFKEPSTWYGFLQLSVAFGVLTLSPEQKEALENLVPILTGVAAASIVTPDRQHKDGKDE